jgi:arylsulfatase A-like enzyme
LLQIALIRPKSNGNYREFGCRETQVFLKIAGMRTKCSSGWCRAVIAVLAGLTCVALASLASAQTNQVRQAAPRKPSIIFILADDLGYGDLGCYGHTKIKTPNLDKVAAEGMRFTSFYAGSTVCAPSRCVLMTGLHTGHARIRGNSKQALRADDITVAEVLKAAGYHTCLFGKWGLGDENTSGLPQKQGFDEVAGYLDQTHAHDYYTDHLYRYDPATGFEGPEMLLENHGGFKRRYTHDIFTSAALMFIRANKPDRSNNQRPFFLYLAYTIPHANNEEGKRTGNGMEVPDDEPYTREPWPQTEKNKAAMITRLDGDVGKLMDLLKELGIDDNTIVVFTSDNGPHAEGGADPKFLRSAGPLRGIKRDLYEGGIRVPLLVRWPLQIRPGQVNHEPWAFWDILPTTAEIAGVKAPAGLDGISMLPTLLEGAQTNRHAFLYWEFHERGFQQAARMGDWKAVRPQAKEPLELYNLKRDLGETNNVAPKEPDVVAKFEEYFKTARSESAEWPIKPPKPSAPASSKK